MSAQIILAFDYGRRRIGVARSVDQLAEPLKIIENSDDTLTRIEELINHYQPQALVIGISEQQMAVESQEFASQLKKAFNLPIFLVDETLSSVEAKTLISQQTPGKRKYKGPIDHYAAALILQNYLDERTSYDLF